MSDRYWYFAPKDRRLRFDDGRLIQAGTTHTVQPPIEPRKRGLHASRRAIDALQYAPSQVVCRVSLGGEIMHDGDKSCATERTYLSVIDAEDTLLAFARRCALDVIDLWGAPDIAREFLETGDENIRAQVQKAAHFAAWEAAWSAAGSTAQAAAWAAAWAAARPAREAALESAEEAARAAARQAARDTSRKGAFEAAWSKKFKKYNDWLEAMLLDLEAD